MLEKWVQKRNKIFSKLDVILLIHHSNIPLFPCRLKEEPRRTAKNNMVTT
jgi:hypothetical protein